MLGEKFQYNSGLAVYSNYCQEKLLEKNTLKWREVRREKSSGCLTFFPQIHFYTTLLEKKSVLCFARVGGRRRLSRVGKKPTYL